MGFWSGFEGLTGHRPGAFKGFSFKDILDDDLWKRKQRIRQQPGWDEGLGRYAKVGEPLFNDRTGEKMMTNWYKGRGRPELMNPRVGGGVADQPRQPAFSSPMRPEGAISGPRLAQESPRVDKTFPPYAEQHAAIMRNRYPGGQATVSAARPWPNIQAQMLSDPRQGVESMRIPPAELMGEKTTVKKIFADPTKSDTVTETIKEKVPMGNMRIPTSELMGGPTVRREHSGYFPPPPNWLERTGFNPGYFGRPASIMNMRIPTSELAGGRDEDRIREMFRVLQGMRARRGY